MVDAPTDQTLDYSSESYRDAFSRINGIVIEGEQEAYDNFASLAALLPVHTDELIRLGRMEYRHRKSFEACGQNLKVTPQLTFAQNFFADLRQAFAVAEANNQIATCLLIQALVIECFAIAAYNAYIPVADPFAQKITEAVVADEYQHLNFGESWLKANFESVQEELQAANRRVLPIIWRMLNQIEADAATIGIHKQTLIEEFMVRYGEALAQIGFGPREILRMISHGLKTQTQS